MVNLRFYKLLTTTVHTTRRLIKHDKFALLHAPQNSAAINHLPHKQGVLHLYLHLIPHLCRQNVADSPKPSRR